MPPPLVRTRALRAAVAAFSVFAATALMTAFTGSIRYEAVPRRTATVGAGEQARATQALAPPAARAPSVRRCSDLQKEVADKEKLIRTHRGSVEANQRWADDIDRSPFSRHKYELRAEEEARWLARAQQELEYFIDAQRRRGAPPSCLR